MSNIKRIRIKNFKNLEDVEIEVKPLTFLFGPNGSGKSSFLKAMMFLSKNISPVNTGKTIYKLNNNIDLGTFKDIVTNNDESKIIEFEFDLEGMSSFPSIVWYKKNSNLLRDLFKNPLKYKKYIKSFNFSVTYTVKFWKFDYSYNLLEISIKDNINLYKYEFTQNFTDYDQIELDEIEIDYYNLDEDIYSLICPTGHTVLCKEHFYFKSNELSKLFNLYFGNVSWMYDRFQDDKFSIYFDFMKIISEISRNDVLKPDFNKYKGKTISEEWEILTIDQKTEVFYEVLRFGHLTNRIIQKNISEFFNYFYIPSIRETPKRKYLIQNEEIDSSEYFGFLKILLNEKTLLKASDIFRAKKTIKKNGLIIVRSRFSLINEYIEKLGFDFQFDLAKNEDAAVIYLFKDNLEFNLADASSGVIQIFPILVSLTILTIKYGMLNNENNQLSNIISTLFVEQPELHLHPKLQSNLADIFSETIKNSENNLFIETHSEHLIRKIQVLIAEGNLDKNKVSVMYFNNKNGVTKVENMEIDDNGLFKKDWPDGFFDDSVNLTMELFEALRKRKN